jgi:predicted DCC family thiol-disulfide oxidoreductase YuxK
MKTSDYLYQGTAATLGILRIVVFGLCFVYVLGVPYTQLAILPATLHNPTAVFSLLPSTWQAFLISQPGLSTVKPLLLICLICSVVGLRPFRLWAPASVVLLLVFDMVYKGYAYFFWHGQFALIYCAVILAISPCVDAYRISAARSPAIGRDAAYKAAPLLIGVAMTACYALLGIRRIVEGNVAIYFDDTLLNYTAVRAFEQAFFTFQFGLWPLHSPALAILLKLGFAVVTIFEALSPLAVISQTFRRVWVCVILAFHVTTLLTMNIWFWENALLVLLFFTPFAYRLGQTSHGFHPTLFFDGSCALCNGSLRWLARRDAQGVLRFAPLGGITARKHGLPDAENAGSMYLLDGQGMHGKSTSALRSLLSMNGGWALLGSLALSVPRPIRDFIYDMVAKRRYRWFGRCELPVGDSRLRNILP